MDQRPRGDKRSVSSEDIRREAWAYREKKARIDRARQKAEGRPSSERRRRHSGSASPRPGPSASSRPPRKRRRRVITPRGWLVLVLLGLILLLGLTSLFRACSGPPSSANSQERSSEQSSDPVLNGLLSQSAIVIDVGNGNILFEQDPDEARYPASLTKMMTVFVAVQSGENLDQDVTLTQEAFDGLYEAGASTSGFEVGEVVSFRDLLYASMLASGGEASNALALAVSGDIDRFVDRMNDQAKSIGMDSTHFRNPTGLHDSEQKSTARDLARFLKHALGNADFRQIFCSSSYSSSPTNYHPDGLTFQASYLTHMEEFNLRPPQDSYEILGAKTGYTPEAGICLASLAGEDHQEYVAVTLAADGDGENYYPALKDSLRLYDQAFASQ